jgi:hypothetical protein
MRVYWISLSYATFCIDVTGVYVTAAAPIAKWAIGKKAYQVMQFYRNRGATVVELKPFLVQEHIGE